MKDAAAIGIIGGADGPTAIFLASKLSPNLLGAIAVAAYSYMALVPIIQPPIMRALTSKEERSIEMKQLRHVKKIEKITSFQAACLEIWAKKFWFAKWKKGDKSLKEYVRLLN